MSRRVPRGDVGPWRDGEPENGPPWDQGAHGRENTRGYAEQPRYDGQRQRHDGQGERYDGQRQRATASASSGDGQGERHDGQRERPAATRHADGNQREQQGPAPGTW